MMRLRFVVLVQLVIVPALGVSASESKAAGVADKPEALVSSLYRKVVDHPPYGALEDGELESFAPYISQSLHRKFELALACSQDWFRQNPARDIKAPFAWSESGPFSGANERELPGEFQIEKVKAGKDGLFRVDVRLRYRPVDGGGWWRVEDIVVRENGRFVVDDVVYLKDKDMYKKYRLSEVLTEGCDGARWVGPPK